VGSGPNYTGPGTLTETILQLCFNPDFSFADVVTNPTPNPAGGLPLSGAPPAGGYALTGAAPGALWYGGFPLVKSDQGGWLPRSSPTLSGSIYSTLTADGILTTIAKPISTPNITPSENQLILDYAITTIDLNTGNVTEYSEYSTYTNQVSPSESYCSESISFDFSGVFQVQFTPYPAPGPSLALLNPYACSILGDCSTLQGTDCSNQGINFVIAGGSALGISADGESAALIVFTSSDTADPVQIDLSATGFSGAMGTLASYDPNFLNESSPAGPANTSLNIQSPTFCDNDGNGIFLALLWAPNTMSGECRLRVSPAHNNGNPGDFCSSAGRYLPSTASASTGSRHLVKSSGMAAAARPAVRI
jgi:hypothetical protein